MSDAPSPDLTLSPELIGLVQAAANAGAQRALERLQIETVTEAAEQVMRGVMEQLGLHDEKGGYATAGRDIRDMRDALVIWRNTKRRVLMVIIGLALTAIPGWLISHFRGWI